MFCCSSSVRSSKSPGVNRISDLPGAQSLANELHGSAHGHDCQHLNRLEKEGSFHDHPRRQVRKGWTAHSFSSVG